MENSQWGDAPDGESSVRGAEEEGGRVRRIRDPAGVVPRKERGTPR